APPVLQVHGRGGCRGGWCRNRNRAAEKLRSQQDASSHEQGPFHAASSARDLDESLLARCGSSTWPTGDLADEGPVRIQVRLGGPRANGFASAPGGRDPSNMTHEVSVADGDHVHYGRVWAEGPIAEQGSWSKLN